MTSHDTDWEGLRVLCFEPYAAARRVNRNRISAAVESFKNTSGRNGRLHENADAFELARRLTIWQFGFSQGLANVSLDG